MLTKETLEEINMKLDFLHNVIDNTLYNRYSVQGLKDELESIRDLQMKLATAMTDADEEE